MTASCVSSSHRIASAPDAGAPSVPARETWYVATSSGTRAMTLDELDEALERGEVDTSTPLWIPGMAEWEALGSVANLEDGPPLECTPGAMLEYGLDAERALADSDGSVRAVASDMRDYDPFSFPPPAPNIPDPNGALWASILPSTPHTGARRSIEPWWRGDGRLPWVGLVLSGTFVLCLSLAALVRPYSSASADEVLRAETRALAPQPSLASERSALSTPVALGLPATSIAEVSAGEASADEVATSEEAAVSAEATPAAAGEEAASAREATGAASALVRYDEPERTPRALAVRTPLEQAVGKRKMSARAAVKKRAARVRR
jgi:hypothetical protein